MAGSKKAKGKHRLDKFYFLAKEQGFRSRAAFKLVQLNKKYDFLSKATSLLDLCAAPGGWLQVAHKYMPMSSIIVGIDLVPIKPIRGVITLTEDITTERCRAAIKKVLPPGGLFDVVVCDGAPNVGGNWSSESYTQAALVLEACRLATDFLAPQGLFVTKVFRSTEYHALLYAFHQLFERVESTKPLASRGTSAEIFVACHGYRAPGKLDRRLLDPGHLFAPTGEAADGVARLGEAGEELGDDVLQRKDGETKRHRGGYETATGVLYKPGDAEAVFIASARPAEALGAYSALTIAPRGELDGHPATTEEVRAACADLRVLGKKDFRALLKWREAVRRGRALAAKAEAAAAPAAEEADAEEEAEEEEEEDELAAEMEGLQGRAEARKRREKKSKAKAKAKARLRAALGADAAGPAVAGESAFGADLELFALRQVTGGAAGLASVADVAEARGDDGDGEGEGEESLARLVLGEAGAEEEEEEEGQGDARLEAELELMYAAYAARRKLEARKPSKLRRTRLGAGGELASVAPDADAEQEWDEQGTALAARTAEADAAAAADRNPLLMGAVPRPAARGSAATEAWFSNPMFTEAEEEAEGARGGRAAAAAAAALAPPRPAAAGKKRKAAVEEEDDDDEDIRAAARAATKGWENADGPEEAAPGRRGGADFQVVPAAGGGDSDSESGSESDSLDRELDEELDDDEKAEIRALGRLFLKRKTRDAAVEAGYHKWAWGGEDDLPPWFEQDEGRHCRIALPITAGEAAAEKAALRAIDARPAKKVAEARARKKKRLHARLEAAKAQANAIADQEDVPLASRMRQIERVYAKSNRKGGQFAKGDKKAAAKPGAKGAKGPKLDARMRADKRTVGMKGKLAKAKKSKQKSKKKGHKSGSRTGQR